MRAQQLYSITMLIRKINSPVAPLSNSLKTGRQFFVMGVLCACLLFTMGVQAQVAKSDSTRVNTKANWITVRGKVTNPATKTGAAGVHVEVTGVAATITDDDGNYKLKVPGSDAVLTFSGEGFSTRQVALKGRTSLDVQLLDDSHESQYSAVEMPFGKQLKNQLTASVADFNINGYLYSREIPDALLQGRIAGLNVIRRSGSPGAGGNMFLRGYNSLYATNKPLVVIDNMIFDANDYGESIIANNYTNPLSLIDVKDIDNVTVLRDASSIYGTKGANGAIIITTARAQGEATKIDFAAYTGFNKAPQHLPVMNAADYRVYLSSMLQSKGLTANEIQALPYMNDDPSNPDYASYHFNTDWQKKVLANSLTRNIFLKVSGGDNIATYALSTGYMKDEGIINTTNLTRYNTRFNAEFNFSRRFSGYTNLSFTYNEQNLKDQGMAGKTAPVLLSLYKAPFLFDHEVNSQGVESPNLSDKDSFGIGNPTAIINSMQAYNKYYRFFGSFGFKLAINKSWNAATIVGITFDKVRENIFVPSKGVAKDTLNNAVANNRLGTQVKRLYSLFNDTRIEYNKEVKGLYTLSSRLGVRYQHNEAEQDYVFGYNSATDELVSVQNGVAALRQVGGGLGTWNWLNNYLNSEFALRSKYFLSLNVAMDGSSRFGKEAKNGVKINGYKFPIMPSLAAAWLISSERFMAHSSFDLLKLRASWSVTGNDDIGNYTSRQTYGSQNLLGLQGLVRNGISNPSLQWETNYKLNGGVDLAFWNERVNLSADFYSTRTNNMLVYKNLASVTGFNTILTNEGSMRNAGMDWSLNVRVLNRAKLNWDLGVIFSKYRNKIFELPGESFTTEYAGGTILTAEEKWANLFYGYVSNGVFSTNADAAAAGLKKLNADGSYSNFSAGDIKFADINGDHIIDENDRTIIGNPNPDFTGGITNRVAWRNFELNALVTFSQGNDVYNYLRRRLESQTGTENQLVSVNNRWRNEGQVTPTPQATWGDPMDNSRFSNRWIEDGSYLRLRSISLQYFIPLKSNVINSATVYVTGNNIFTLTKYKGFDPEFSASPSVFAQGIDTGLDPLFKTVTLGVRIAL
jgi:TonB-linked SusC/RagA family outer membrane protein